MHPLMCAVLARRRGRDALMLNAQAHPPHAERRESVDTGRRERRAVVRANGPRQPVRAKRRLEDRSRRPGLRRQAAVAVHQEARVEIGDRQRIALDPVARAELALEVGGPEVVRRLRVDGRRPGMVRACRPFRTFKTFRAPQSSVLDPELA